MLAGTGLVLLSAAGCGSGNSLDLAAVKGTVTYAGKPLDHGRIAFTPTGNTQGPQAVAIIKPGGEFVMKTANSEGVVVGTHKVTVVCRRVVSQEEARNLIVGELLIPRRFADAQTTPLVFEVKKGDNNIMVALESNENGQRSSVTYLEKRVKR